jgi:hypothetical protein
VMECGSGLIELDTNVQTFAPSDIAIPSWPALGCE